MAEKIISPGVFTKEIDQSFLPAAVGEIGAAVIGPTVKGPALVPTTVNSFAEYEARFGTSFKSGSVGGSYLQYLTSHTAEQYLKNAGTMTVVRILDGDYNYASACIPTGSVTLQHATSATATGSHVATAGDGGGSAGWGKTGTVSFKLHTLGDGAIMNSSSGSLGKDDSVGTNSALLSGSKHNLRWEVTSVNTDKGTFNLSIRRGDDTIKRKTILENWNNLSLDPGAGNFIARVIGDSKLDPRDVGSTTPYLQPSGSYPNQSKYVRVETIKTTPDYIDANGNVEKVFRTGSLPGLNSGSFGGATNGYGGFSAVGAFQGVGATQAKCLFYENIGASTQCYSPSDTSTADGGKAYYTALRLLANADEYDINMILLPGLNQNQHSAIITQAIDVCEERGDCFVVVDPTPHDSNITTATAEAGDYDSNFAAMYWPWVQIPDNQVGTVRWVPPSVVIPGVYAFNDRVAHPWFAPAGLNRGGIDVAIQAERKLTHANRDDLYDANVNPIATFPGQGVTVWGQKTLQKKASALDRINVRRLLIRVKKFIASSSRFLVFEQNTAATRKRFLSIVNPFMEQIQANSGLNAFRVVMDETNNTPDVVDRNILYGQIFVQPTRTAEFIVLDFTVQPTGAAFPE